MVFYRPQIVVNANPVPLPIFFMREKYGLVVFFLNAATLNNLTSIVFKVIIKEVQQGVILHVIRH